jgi:hypothetical protein
MIEYPPAEQTPFERRLVAAGHPVKDRISEHELRGLYGDLLSRDDLLVCVGTGWRELVYDALDLLAGLNVGVSTVREKLGGCQIITCPRGRWRDDAHMQAVSAITKQAWERSLLTCEVCGEPGSRGDGFPIRCRCIVHWEVV